MCVQAFGIASFTFGLLLLSGWRRRKRRYRRNAGAYELPEGPPPEGPAPVPSPVASSSTFSTLSVGALVGIVGAVSVVGACHFFGWLRLLSPPKTTKPTKLYQIDETRNGN